MIEIVQELLKQKRSLLLAIVVLVLVNVTMYLVQNNLLAPRTHTAELRFDDLRRRSAAEGTSDVSTVYKRGVDDLKSFSSRIPAKRQFPQVLGDLMEMASSNTLSVAKMSYKPQLLKEQDLLAYSLSMSVQGSYAAVKGFVADLQSKHELLIIDHAAFTNDNPYEESVGLDLKITVYLHNQEGV